MNQSGNGAPRGWGYLLVGQDGILRGGWQPHTSSL